MVALMLHKSPKICLACSAGGHLRELQLAIGAIPEQWDCYWLTLKTTSTKAFMEDQGTCIFSEFSTSKEMDTDSELFASNILGAGETPRCNHYYRSWCDCTYGFFRKKTIGDKSNIC